MATALSSFGLSHRPWAILGTTVALAVGLGAVAPARAAFINHADVNGLRTFQDTHTGRVWLDLDNFVDANHHLLPGYESVGQMRAAAQAAGFVMAEEGDVWNLLNDTTSPSAIWAHLEGVMTTQHGAALIGPPDYLAVVEILSGYMLSPVGGSIFRYEARADSVSWSIANHPGFPTDLFFDAGSYSRVGLWAYLDDPAPGNTVPEPTSLILAGLGLALVARRKR